MYVTQEEVEDYGLQIMTGTEYECKTANNEADGGWLPADNWWTRSLTLDRYNLFYRVNKVGAAGQTFRDTPSTNECALCLQFSV